MSSLRKEGWVVSPQGVMHLNGPELLFGEARQLMFVWAVGYILSPLGAVVAEKSKKKINPIP
jgi:hypothetical protein